jgi:hypothetical protein
MQQTARKFKGLSEAMEKRDMPVTVQPRLSSAIIAIGLIAFPASVSAFSSLNGLRVNPVDANVFEVVGKAGTGGRDFWCAAANYAQTKLGAPWRSSLYIVRGRGPSVTTNRKTAVQFTQDAAAAGVTPIGSSISLNALNVGENMSVQMAYSYCEPNRSRW